LRLGGIVVQDEVVVFGTWQDVFKVKAVDKQVDET
jgi:hypothetical protein